MRGLGRLRRRSYRPSVFWNGRAEELIETYDHPERWPELGWMVEGAEEEAVPRILRAHDVQTVLVVGAGSGRQYGYLPGFSATGVDISPRLVEECHRRYPHITTDVADITTLEHPTVDAILSSGVLQHITPGKIEHAIDRLKSVAARVMVLRETTRLDVNAPHQFAHDYRTLLAPEWSLQASEVTDERDIVTVELLTFVPES
jgi:SAM-dependent methyltransferase